MTPRKAYAVYRLLDCEPDVALIRYDGDPDVFAALAQDWLREEYQDCDRSYSAEPPKPRLYRMNPSSDPDYGWQLGTPAKRGPGVFLGAILTVGRRWNCGYCFAPYNEAHADDCATSLRPAITAVAA